MAVRMIVGLGNPGRQYERTRHNVGFMAAEAVLSRWRAGPDRVQDSAIVSPASIAGVEAIVVRPQTYMNLSGNAVSGVARRRGIEPSEILLIYDDADLALGSLRIRSGGSPGGHRGVASAVERLGTREIARMRLGIGRDEGDLADHVLAPFSRAEQPLVTALIDRAADAVEMIVKDGLTAAMNRFNRRGEDPAGE